jgi:hypothetical protein
MSIVVAITQVLRIQYNKKRVCITTPHDIVFLHLGQWQPQKKKKKIDGSTNG